METTVGTKKFGDLKGVSRDTVAKWCREGLLEPKPTQDKPGSPWHIDINARLIRERKNIKTGE